MSQTQINVKIDSVLKLESENILNNLGLNISEAMRIFLKKIVSERGLPFDLKLKDDYYPNKTTIEAIMSEDYEEVKDLNDLWK